MRGDKSKLLSLGERCCGCGACEAVCAKGCIILESDELGFRYPRTDEDSCSGCGMCERVCPALDGREEDDLEAVWWAKAEDDDLRFRSSSGGVLGLLSQVVLNGGGTVYGAAFADECKMVHHVRVDVAEELDSVMRSKYVQSEVSAEIYRGVETDLRAGLPVLFCGTACQVSGMRSYLEVRRAPIEGLLLVDVICHGVPSPELWGRWLRYRARCVCGEIHSVSFRSKITGWSSYSMLYEYRVGKDNALRLSASKFADDWYMRTFLANASLRSSCFRCPAKRSCGSDLTLGDFWGVQKYHPEAYDERGVSAVITNTPKGHKAIEALGGLLTKGGSTFDAVVAGNSALMQSAVPHPQRKKFLDMVVDGTPLSDIIEQWEFEVPFWQRIRRKLKNAARWVVRRQR